jgi:hypothetical protein
MDLAAREDRQVEKAERKAREPAEAVAAPEEDAA